MAYFKEIAIVIEVFGNVAGSPMWNKLLITPDGYMFGNRKDTMSYVLAINKKLGTLSKTGLLFAKTLEFFEKDHLEKSITRQQ